MKFLMEPPLRDLGVISRISIEGPISRRGEGERIDILSGEQWRQHDEQ
jgi:hypothetical protein